MVSIFSVVLYVGMEITFKISFPSDKLHSSNLSLQCQRSRAFQNCVLLHIFIKILFIKKKKDFIYLFMRDTQREAETQAEGEAGSMQGA